MNISLKNATPLPGEIFAFQFLLDMKSFNLISFSAICTLAMLSAFSKDLSNMQKGW